MMSYKEHILNAIEEKKDGISTIEVARRVGVSRITATKYLSVLKSEGKCEVIEIGPSKLWLPKTNSTDPSIDLQKDLKESENISFSHIVDGESIEHDLDDLTISLSFMVKGGNVRPLIKIIKEIDKGKY